MHVTNNKLISLLDLCCIDFSVGNNGMEVGRCDTLPLELHIVSVDSICNHGGIIKIRM